MPRRRRPFIRPDADRDARLIVIAAEDSKATIAYFQALVSPRWYQSSRVHVELLTRATTASAPRHVLQQLNQWREEYQIGADDELWLVIDVDRWGNAELSDVARYLPHVETAITRARLLDERPSDRWPQGLGTRVYLLAQSIIDSAAYRRHHELRTPARE